MSSKESLTIIVPALNEVANIEGTLEDIMAQVPHLPMSVKIWMVDDGSTDGTAEVMKSLCERYDNCQMRINPKNMGVGRTVLSTYEVIDDNDWVTVIPGDNEFRFESIHNFMKVRHEYDIVLGYFQNPVIRTIPRRIGSNGFRLLANMLYGFSFRYLNGMKLYKLHALKGIKVDSGGHAYNAELLAKAVLRNPELRLGEAPFIARGRGGGASNAFRPRAIRRAVGELYRGMKAVDDYRDEMIRSEESS